MSTDLAPDGLEDQEELWSSSDSSDDENEARIGNTSTTLTKRASPFTQSTFHCFCVVVYVGIKTYESTIFKAIPPDAIKTSFGGWNTFGSRWKYLTYINLVRYILFVTKVIYSIIIRILVDPVFILFPRFLHGCGSL